MRTSERVGRTNLDTTGHPSPSAAMNTSSPESTPVSFWWMHASAKSFDHIIKLSDSKPPKLRYENHHAVAQSFDPQPSFIGSELRSFRKALNCPPARFKATSREAYPSILWYSLSFYSGRLREALGLDEEAVQYLPIDAAECYANFQFMDYRLAHVLQIGDPFDLERSDFGRAEVMDPAGQTREVWQMKLELQLKRLPTRLVFRQGYVPPAPLFTARWAGYVLATTELAERVLTAGIDDVEFQDLTYADPGFNNVRLKTQDGVHVWSVAELRSGARQKVKR